MLEITRLTVEHLAQGCVTDCPAPRIGFAVQSDRNDAELTDAIFPTASSRSCEVMFSPFK